MFRDKTYEGIIESMLTKVPEGVNKLEGSFIHDALDPVALELAQAYIELEQINYNISLDTATGHELTELCYQNGTFRKGATKAIREGQFNIAIPIGSRFSAEGNTTYIVLEKIKDFKYKLQCEQEGEIGNYYTGILTPFDYILGLSSAVLTSVIVTGVEEETDEQLRERHRIEIIEGSQDGNVSQYKEWVNNFNGVGTAKVFPLWNGGNTVKVAVTDRLFKVGDSTLVDELQNYLDPGSEGLGNGVAPIGSKVTVTGGIKKEINITGNIVLAEGYLEPQGVAEAVSQYFSSITFVKDSVSYMRTAVAILDTVSIVDMNSFTVNGGIEDVPLIGEEIPILNSINLTVVSSL